MRRLSAAIVMLCFCHCASAPMALTPRSVERREDERIAATIAGDIKILAGILSDDWLMIRPDGSVLSKEQYLTAIREGRLKYESIEHINFRIRRFGTTAIITGEAHASWYDSSGKHQGVSKYTHVYVLEGSALKMVSAQVTRVAP